MVLKGGPWHHGRILLTYLNYLCLASRWRTKIKRVNLRVIPSRKILINSTSLVKNGSIRTRRSLLIPTVELPAGGSSPSRLEVSHIHIVLCCVTPHAHVATCCASCKTLRTCPTGFVRSLKGGKRRGGEKSPCFELFVVSSAAQKVFRMKRDLHI